MDKLLHACLNDNNDIFEELRKMRKCSNNSPNRIDGSNDPAGQFANVYKKLYNSVDDKVDTIKILENIEKGIDSDSLQEVDRVTTELIQDITREIKPRKTDPVFTFNSDCIKRAPLILFQHLANIIRCFLIHGHASPTLLLATIVPLLKDKLGDIESSDNYRSIALSSIVLKIFDWVVISMFEKLSKRLQYNDVHLVGYGKHWSIYEEQQ